MIGRKIIPRDLGRTCRSKTHQNLWISPNCFFQQRSIFKEVMLIFSATFSRQLCTSIPRSGNLPFSVAPAAHQQSDLSSHCGLCLFRFLFACEQIIFCKKLTPDGSVMTLKTPLKDTFCKKLTPDGSVHRKCLKTLFSLNDILQEVRRDIMLIDLSILVISTRSEISVNCRQTYSDIPSKTTLPFVIVSRDSGARNNCSNVRKIHERKPDIY